mmetsp:Transcript_15252/g.27721  ORF Transcript_15252/g.27721 Transcript_15252/m.27721 type:complete len:139 (+) Transcript_15252:2148-2564(+)
MTAATAAQTNAKTTTMIVMTDSRSLEVDDYHKLAYTINSHYAKIHGYTIRDVQTPCLEQLDADKRVRDNGDELPKKTCIDCIHPKCGGRMTPWCKIKAINDTMHRYQHQHAEVGGVDVVGGGVLVVLIRLFTSIAMHS